MSDLTDEFRDAILEIAGDLNEAVTAQLIEEPDRIYDVGSGGYSDGTAIVWEFACPPISAPRQVVSGAEEAIAESGRIQMPRLTRADGSIVVPQRGQRVSLLGVTYVVESVKPIQVGGGYAGFTLGVRA